LYSLVASGLQELMEADISSNHHAEEGNFSAG
jgi:hypothetical protein